MRISTVVLIQCFPECDLDTGGGLLEGLDERIDINLSGNGLYCFLTGLSRQSRDLVTFFGSHPM
jgi:hypothetical protein